jgi:hypothetical protein
MVLVKKVVKVAMKKIVVKNNDFCFEIK